MRSLHLAKLVFMLRNSADSTAAFDQLIRQSWRNFWSWVNSELPLSRSIKDVYNTASPNTTETTGLLALSVIDQDFKRAKDDASSPSCFWRLKLKKLCSINTFAKNMNGKNVFAVEVFS